MRPRLAAATASVALLLVTATPALACGGLIGPNGAVNLLKTTTLAGYSDGIEHYVTAALYPSGLTRRVQIVLGLVVLGVNGWIYWKVWRRRGLA